jgi:integrase/recombinase XerD
MPKRGQQSHSLPIGNATDSQGLWRQSREFLAWMAQKNYSPRTIGNHDTNLGYFLVWCHERGLSRPQEITRPILERYQRHLFLYRKANGEPLPAQSQHKRIAPVRALFKWLTKQNRLLYNPAADLDMPRMEQRLPKHVLNAQEAERILNVPDVKSAVGLRDRAILEVLYSTGMRRMELINLHQFDVDHERGTVMIRQGKGRKDRMIPIGARALAWLRSYCDEVRGQFALARDEGVLFLTAQGLAFTPNRLTQLVREHINAAGTGKSGSCHLFRHTMATLMLENGADIRIIQEMLGHVSLETTQIYTRVSIRHLKDVHTLTHPARLERVSEAVQINPVGSKPPVNPELPVEPPEVPVPPATREALLAELEREAEAEQGDMI